MAPGSRLQEAALSGHRRSADDHAFDGKRQGRLDRVT